MEGFQSFFVLSISTIAIIVVLKGVKTWLQDYLRIVRLMRNVPGPVPLPIIGNALGFIVRPQNQYLEKLGEITEEHHPFFRLWNGSFLCSVFMSSWKYAEKILNNSDHIEKYLFYNFLHPWLGTGLLTSTGEKWHSRRKLLTPGFHRSILDRPHEVITRKSLQLIEVLKSKSNASQPFDIAPHIWQCSLDIICGEVCSQARVFPGSFQWYPHRTIQNGPRLWQLFYCGMYKTLMERVPFLSFVLCQSIVLSENNWNQMHFFNLFTEYQTFSNIVNDFFPSATSSFIRRCVRPWLHPKLIYDLTPTGRKYNRSVKIMHNFTDKVIKTRKEEYFKLLKAAKENGSDNTGEVKAITAKRKAFLDILIEAAYPEGDQKKPILSDEDIREEVSTFMFEGHDTTASAITWALYLLGHNPDIQEKVLEEIEDVFGSDFVATSDKVSELRLLERCIKESLRLYPSVPFIARKLNKDITLGDHTIPSKTGVFILIYFLHRDPEIFPQPEKFNPDNFLPEACEKRPPYAYVPFSAGPRNCIGQKFAMLEEKIVLSHILKNFKIESVDKPKDLKILIDAIIRSENGINICLHPRT